VIEPASIRADACYLPQRTDDWRNVGCSVPVPIFIASKVALHFKVILIVARIIPGDEKSQVRDVVSRDSAR
jgi:hypothetical protein